MLCVTVTYDSIVLITVTVKCVYMFLQVLFS